MEQSAFEAVMIGVNVFVFIAALTAGVLLMTNIIDMVNYANDSAIVGMNGTIAESIEDINERIYTGEQLISYYRKENEITELGKKETNNVFYVKLSEGSSETELSTFIEGQVLTNYLNKKFILQYKGEISGNHNYVFVMK